MDIRYAGRNVTVTEGMKEHLREKLSKLDRYAPKIVEAHAVLKKERYVFCAEITLLAKKLRAFGEGSSKENIFAAIDGASAKIEKQLKKFREKVKDHHKQDVPEKRRAVKTRPVFEDNGPSIVRTRSFVPKPMSPEEASTLLALSPKPFLVFENAETQTVNVIYKREDGDHGLVEPES